MHHRWWGTAVVSTAALTLLVGSQGAAVALPAKAPTGGEFASSFESGDPSPDWLNTVDTAPDGAKRPPASTADTAPASPAT